MGRAILVLLLCNLLGGITYPLQDAALEGLPPATIAALRSLLALGCMAGWLRLRREAAWPFDRRECGRLALVGIAALALPLLLGVVGVRLSTAINGSLLILLEPVSILLFARVLLGDRIGGTRAAGVAVGLCGAVLVAVGGAGGAGAGSDPFLGNVLLAASGILWGLYTPLVAPLAKRHGAVAIAFAATAFALLLFVPAALLETASWERGPRLLQALLFTAVLGVLSSFLGTVLWNLALRDVPSAVVAPFVLLQPAVGAVGGALFRGEEFTWQALAGGGIAAAGVVLVILGERRAPAPA
jgi:drug/metabolite transporter (DMT)-like permease